LHEDVSRHLGENLCRSSPVIGIIALQVASDFVCGVGRLVIDTHARGSGSARDDCFRLQKGFKSKYTELAPDSGLLYAAKRGEKFWIDSVDQDRAGL
jgi:hypothetical protein